MEPTKMEVLDLALRTAQDQAILNWAMAVKKTLPVSLEELSAIRKEFFAMTWEEREVYRLRPNKNMAATVRAFLATPEGQEVLQAQRDLKVAYFQTIPNEIAKVTNEYDVADQMDVVTQTISDVMERMEGSAYLAPWMFRCAA